MKPTRKTVRIGQLVRESDGVAIHRSNANTGKVLVCQRCGGYSWNKRYIEHKHCPRCDRGKKGR